METGCVSRVKGLVLLVCSPPAVVVCVWSPVERGRDDVVAAFGVCVVVTAGFHDVDLTGCWPVAVNIVLWQHPDRRPKPVTLGQLSLDFDTSVLDRFAGSRADTSRLDWVHNRAVCSVGDRDTVRPDIRGAFSLLEQVDDVVSFDQLLILKRRLDVEHSILDKYVLVGVCGHLELAIAMIQSACGSKMRRIIKSYPNPPDSTSLVHASERPPEKSSSIIEQ